MTNTSNAPGQGVALSDWLSIVAIDVFCISYFEPLWSLPTFQGLLAQSPLGSLSGYIVILLGTSYYIFSKKSFDNI